MREQSFSEPLSKLIAVGSFLITIFVWTGISDPVNIPKLLLLGVFGIPVGLLGAVTHLKRKNHNSKKLFVILGAFLFFASFSSVMSKSPVSQNFYGVYGRNSGLLTYSLFICFAIGASALDSKKQVIRVVLSLITAGLVNFLYSAYVILFGDFVPWENQYRAILGTFGNPNFVSSFLGIFAVLIFAISLGTVKFAFRFGLWLLICFTVFEIAKSRSIQGLVVVALGISLILYFKIRSLNLSRKISNIFAAFVSIIFTLAVLGTQQIGPLTEYLYKPSVSFREQYWYAGIKMGFEEPIIGVGMDAYGDWYRRARGAESLVNPGINVTTNAAHNVVIDLFSYGGFPLLISYSIFTILTFIFMFKLLFHSKIYDYLNISICVVYMCFQAQSLISINQIGLGIWGWILPGLIWSIYSITENVSKPTKLLKKSVLKVPPSYLIVMPSMVFGFLLTYPPFSSDKEYVTALKTRDVAKLENSISGSYFFPKNSTRLAQIALILRNSNLPEKSISAARLATQFNSENVDAWKVLFSDPSASENERQIALINLRRLDPYNPEWQNE